MDRLTPLDSLFLHMEDEFNRMHIGSLGVFEGPAPPYGELLAMVASRVPLVPRYRQRVQMVPLNLGRPVWIDDPYFQLEYHVRHTAVPAPGSSHQVRTLASRLMSLPLDRARPLWEVWMVEGLENGRWALLSKAHHCLVDGIAGTELLGVILDESPEPAPGVEDRWEPRPQPSGFTLVTDAIADLIASPYEQWRRLRALTRAPRRAARQMVDIAGGFASAVGVLRPAEPSSLVGPIGPHRRWSWARADMTDVRRVRTRLGGTVNDVLLAAITRGFHDLLVARAESPRQRLFRTLVPVSVRRPDERGVYSNRVSAVIADLPVGVEDPRQRLEAIRRQMEGLKASRQAVAAETLTALSGFAPPLLLALGIRAAVNTARNLPRLQISTVTTNVPGPQHSLYALGRRMIESFPYVPIAGPLRVGVAVFSYEGQFTFGVNADYDSVPDVDVLSRGIEAGIAELVRVAEGQPDAGR